MNNIFNLEFLNTFKDFDFVTPKTHFAISLLGFQLSICVILFFILGFNYNINLKIINKNEILSLNLNFNKIQNILLQSLKNLMIKNSIFINKLLYILIFIAFLGNCFRIEGSRVFLSLFIFAYLLLNSIQKDTNLFKDYPYFSSSLCLLSLNVDLILFEPISNFLFIIFFFLFTYTIELTGLKIQNKLIQFLLMFFMLILSCMLSNCVNLTTLICFLIISRILIQSSCNLDIEYSIHYHFFILNEKLQMDFLKPLTKVTISKLETLAAKNPKFTIGASGLSTLVAGNAAMREKNKYELLSKGNYLEKKMDFKTKHIGVYSDAEIQKLKCQLDEVEDQLEKEAYKTVLDKKTDVLIKSVSTYKFSIPRIEDLL